MIDGESSQRTNQETSGVDNYGGSAGGGWDNKEPPSRKLMFLFYISAITAACFFIPSVRRKLEEDVLPPIKSFSDSAVHFVDDLRTNLQSFNTSSLWNSSFGSRKEEKPQTSPSSSPQTDVTPQKRMSNEDILPIISTEPNVTEEPAPTIEKLLEQPAPAKQKALKKSAPQQHSSLIVDREAEVKTEMERQEKRKQQKNEELSTQLNILTRNSLNFTVTAIKDLKALEDETRKHAQTLQKAIETDTTEEERSKLWAVVFDVSQFKKDKKSTSENSLQKAQDTIQELKNVINEGLSNGDTKTNPVLKDAQATLTQLQYDLSTAVSEMHKAESEYSMVSKYKDLVTSSRAQFQKELQSILPEVDVENKSGQLSRDELHALLVHAHRRVDQLQKHLAEREAMDKTRLATALEQQKQEDEKLALEMLARELERVKNQMVLQKQEWESDVRKDMDDELRRVLAAQAAAHNDHLRDVLRVQMEALESTHKLDIRQHILKERENFYAAIHAWINRVRGIEAAVEGRAEAEKEARTSQELWLATQALWNATEGTTLSGEAQFSSPPWYNVQMNIFRRSDSRLAPLQPLVHVLTDIAEKAEAPFVQHMIAAIPQRAIEEGICSEDQLTKRFQKVKRICRRVCMLNENGASIPMVLLSWLQSVFVFERPRVLGPDDEVLLSSQTNDSHGSEEIKVVGLDRERQVDTFTLLSSAERALSVGDLKLAVRFIGQLRGAPAVVAHDWLVEARLLLETRQVIQAMRAASAARGLSGVELSDGSTVSSDVSTQSSTSFNNATV